MRSQMLTVEEVAAELRLKPKTIRKRILDGELAAIKAGSHRTSPYRIPREALDDYLRQQAVQAAS